MIGRILKSLYSRAPSKATPTPQATEVPTSVASEAVLISPVDRLIQSGLQSRNSGHLELARDFFAEAARLDPTAVLPEFYLGNCASELRDFDAAVGHFKRALERAPDDFKIRLNLAKAQGWRGDVQQRLVEVRTLIELGATDYDTWSTFLMGLHYSDAASATEIAQAHRTWGELFAGPLAPEAQHNRDSFEFTSNRHLRIGYVSGDLRQHSVAYFLEPLLEHHDRSRFEIFCYATLDVTDEVTARMRGFEVYWRSLVGLTDEDALATIKTDAIDILIDLSGHTPGARPGVFARRAAPIQIVYLGYPDTTGNPEMDFRIVDRWTDPPDIATELHSEKLLYLPNTQWCFRPDPNMPQPGSLPMLERGYAVFGALNDFIKVSDTILHCWGRILQESPGAHLRLHRAPKGERIERAIQILSTYGVDRSRISCSDWVASKTSGGQYHGVDIALDSYPYNGVTTTCESFWMGLPVISLRGRNSVSRSGYSLLEAMDLSDLAAADEDAYVRAAVELAQDVPHLSELRQRMRALMRSSGLLDEASFVGSIESLYLQAWDDRVKAFAQPASRSTPS